MKPSTANPRPSASDAAAVMSSITALSTSVKSPSVRMTNGKLRKKNRLDQHVEHAEHERDAEQRDAVARVEMPETSRVATHSAAALIRRRSQDVHGSIEPRGGTLYEKLLSAASSLS